MKRLALIAALMMGVAASCFAQKSTITLNNYDANIAIYLQGATGAPFIAPADTVLTLLGGGVAVQNAAGGATTIAMTEPGFFDVGVGVIPGGAPSTSVAFQLIAKAGGVDYNMSAVWSQNTGNWNDAAVPPAPATGPTLNVPGVGGQYIIQSIPEPSTIALGLLGAALLVLRRRQ